MASPLFSDNPPLSEEAFEEYVKEKELEFLRGLAMDYNNLETINILNRIDLSRIGNDKLKLTVSLWQRGIRPSTIRNIPYLINGERVDMEEPYLSTLIKHSKVFDKEGLFIFKKPEDTYTYLLMKYPEQLRGFMAAGVNLYYNYIERPEIEVNDLDNINKALLKLNLPEAFNKTEFIRIIKTLPILGVIALALIIDRYGAFHDSTGLSEYIELVKN